MSQSPVKFKFETPDERRRDLARNMPGRPGHSVRRLVYGYAVDVSGGAWSCFSSALFTGAATDIINREQSGQSHHALLYTLGIFWLVYSLGSFLYFGCCELLMRGQTIGKRSVHIRVVKTDGFSLDPQSIFVRTIFRVIDHLPMLFIVPLVTERGSGWATWWPAPWW